MRFKGIIFIFLWIFSAVWSVNPVQAQNGSPLIITIQAEGPLTPSFEGYIDRSLRLAEQRDAELFILQLNTPGGSIDLMNNIIQRIRGSSIPVVVYVAPRGAIAGSAGTLITLAGHAAAMAPETAIGAASPVGAQGEDIGETIEAKQKEILRATARSLAADRGEEAIALAEDTIENARAASAEEALEVGLVDYIATDLNDLLEQLNGVTLQVDGQPVTLETENVLIEPVDMTFIEQVLALLTNPNILFLLLTIGVQAIFIELSSPGGWVAGFIGAVSLILAIYGLGILPVNWFGILFLVVAFILFIAEINAPTHGALTAAGVASFVVGALVLFNTVEAPGFPRVSIPLVVGTGILLGLGIFTVLSFAIRAMKQPALMGMESLVGKKGFVSTVLDPQGMVHVAGEDWSAQSADLQTIQEGEPVEVTETRGIQVIVRKTS